MKIGICDDEKEIRAMLRNKVQSLYPEADVPGADAQEENVSGAESVNTQSDNSISGSTQAVEKQHAAIAELPRFNRTGVLCYLQIGINIKDRFLTQRRYGNVPLRRQISPHRPKCILLQPRNLRLGDTDGLSYLHLGLSLEKT